MAACPERAARNRWLRAVPAVDFMRGAEWAKAAQEAFAGKRPEGAPPGSLLPRLSRVDVLRNGCGRFFLRWKVFSDSIIAHHHEWFSTSSMWFERGCPAGRLRPCGVTCRVPGSPAVQALLPDGCFLRKAFRGDSLRQDGGQQAAERRSGKSGAYKLVVSPQGKVAIGAHDERGAFYAMQTLRQLGTKAGGEGVTLPVGEITDWPDIEFRGRWKASTALHGAMRPV